MCIISWHRGQEGCEGWYIKSSRSVNEHDLCYRENCAKSTHIYSCRFSVTAVVWLVTLIRKMLGLKPLKGILAWHCWRTTPLHCWGRRIPCEGLDLDLFKWLVVPLFAWLNKNTKYLLWNNDRNSWIPQDLYFMLVGDRRSYSTLTLSEGIKSIDQFYVNMSPSSKDRPFPMMRGLALQSTHAIVFLNFPKCPWEF